MYLTEFHLSETAYKQSSSCQPQCIYILCNFTCSEWNRHKLCTCAEK